MLVNVSLVICCFVFLLNENSQSLVSAEDVFDCSARDPCRPPFFINSIFKYPHANESLVVNCQIAIDGYIGCIITPCRTGYVFDNATQACILRTYDCNDNGGNPCSPLVIEGKTVYPHHDITKKVQCVKGTCEVKSCPEGLQTPSFYYNDVAQKCLTYVRTCDTLQCTADNPNNWYLGEHISFGIWCTKKGQCKTGAHICSWGRYIAFDDGRQACKERQYRTGKYNRCFTGEFFWEGECIACPAGTKSSLDPNTRNFCDLCPIGKYQPNQGNGSCIDCEPGTFSDSVGTVTCTECPEGSFQDYPGESYCLPCSLGHFQDTSGQVVCKPCEVGTFAEKAGSQNCELCQTAILPGQATCP